MKIMAIVMVIIKATIAAIFLFVKYLTFYRFLSFICFLKIIDNIMNGKIVIRIWIVSYIGHWKYE